LLSSSRRTGFRHHSCEQKHLPLCIHILTRSGQWDASRPSERRKYAETAIGISLMRLTRAVHVSVYLLTAVGGIQIQAKLRCFSRNASCCPKAPGSPPSTCCAPKKDSFSESRRCYSFSISVLAVPQQGANSRSLIYLNVRSR
jgi:hypothetical protein